MRSGTPRAGYRDIRAEVAIRVAVRARIARRWIAIQQEGNRRVAGKLLPVDVQYSAIRTRWRPANPVTAANSDKWLRAVKEISCCSDTTRPDYYHSSYNNQNRLETRYTRRFSCTRCRVVQMLSMRDMFAMRVFMTFRLSWE